MEKEKDNRTEGRGPLDMADFAREAVFGLNRTMAAVYRLAYGTHTAEDCSKTKAEKCGKTLEKRL